MQLLLEGPVLPGEIDTLGHMNVRYYVERVGRAKNALMERLGLGRGALAAQGLHFSQVDLYTRYHREQFEGAQLIVRGAPIGAAAGEARCYFEIYNPAADEVAASFIAKFMLIDQASRAPRDLPAALTARIAAEAVEPPPYGRPRSLDLGPLRTDLSYEQVMARVGEAEPYGHRAPLMEWRVNPEDCDAFGWLRDNGEISFGRPAGNEERHKPPIFTTDEGHRFGWAQLEMRSVNVEQPRAGHALRTLFAEMDIQQKVHRTRRWTFNLATGRVAAIGEMLAIALDIDARKPIAIPKDVRASLEMSFAPEFA